MSEKAKQGRRGRGKGAGDQPSPQWADGLRNIYDSVVNEPLPDDMLALLASLDADGDK
ncbi:NepR family anti-sigma factor [Altererythrobacter palmitatis]|uniref:NepR family anti-sigma factor n=2 Tax=Alteraurantiacibacter palmitatis TaxID=2054628 RepID=A0ABV7EB59_9SPHN